MALYYLNEAVLDLPDFGFVDSTIHGLEAKQPNDRALGVFVHRRAVAAGAALRGLVDESVAENARRLHAFVVESERAALVDDLPGLVLSTRWRHEQRENVQAQAHFLVGHTWMIFAVSAPAEERVTCEETLRSLLETLTFRGEG